MSNKKSSYLIEAKSQIENTLDITPGEVESGELEGEQIKSHILKLPINTVDKHELSIKLHMNSGNAIL